jgi:proline iminopeptidase
VRAIVNGTELFYTIEGAPSGRHPPVLLMHGPGFDHTYFHPWLDPLSEQRRLIYLDSRGSGRSSRSEGFEGVTIDTLVEDIEALRKHLGFDRFILYGHSFGGFVALVYALKHGDHLIGLILDGTAPAFDYQPVMLANAAVRGTAVQVQQLMKAFAGQLIEDDALRQTWKRVLQIYFHRYDPEVGGKMVEEMQFSAAAFNHFAVFFLSINMLDSLCDISTPTLILVGRHDWVCPPAQGGERLHAGLPNSRLVIFEHSGHFPFIEEPNTYLQTVDDWCGKLD